MMNNDQDYSALLLTLYKGKYEIGEHIDQAWGYRAIGEFDYLMIQSIMSDIPTEKLYKEIWKKTDQISQRLNIGESCHNLYAIGEKNRSFWNEEGYPFLFVSMIQLRMENEIKHDEAFNKFKDFLTNKIAEEKYDVRFSIYYSLDSCDLLLFLKTKEYDLGSKIIQEMPTIPYKEGQTLNYYCYSLCGIDIKGYQRANVSQRVNKIMICFIIRDFSVFSAWLMALKAKFPEIEEDRAYKDNQNRQISYSRLGNEDVCINIMNCELGLFLKELSEEGGLLHKSNELFTKGLMKLRLHFDSPQYYTNVDVNSPQKNSFQTLISKFHENINTANEILYPATKKALIEVLNSCSYFEQEYFVKDIQVCIQNSFDIFLSEFHEFIRWNTEKTDKVETISQGTSKDSEVIYSKVTFNRSVIEFINGIMSVMNGALHTDRMFFQAPGFNAVLYDIPAKLLAFYTAYVRKIVDILNDNNEKQFAYLLCPDLYLDIYITKLFDNPLKRPTKRLLKGSIPVQSIFEPKKLMMELAHEVAHCVSDDMRMRQARFRTMEIMIANAITFQLFKYSGKSEKQMEQEKETFSFLFLQKKEGEPLQSNVFGQFLQEIATQIRDWFDRLFKSNCDVNDEFTFYQANTKVFFINAVYILLAKPNELFKFIENKYTDKYIYDVSLTDKIEKIYSLNIIMEGNLHTLLLDSDYVYNMISAVHSLTSESYSDLIMCKMLGISGKEYLHQFFDTNQSLLKGSNLEFLYADATGERIISVLEAFNEKIEDMPEDGGYLYNNYLSSLKNYNESDASKRDSRILLPRKIIKDNVYYLKKCLEQAEKLKMDEKFADIRKIYKDVTEQDMFISVQCILNAVYDMRVEIDKGLSWIHNNEGLM